VCGAAGGRHRAHVGQLLFTFAILLWLGAGECSMGYEWKEIMDEWKEIMDVDDAFLV
jgi:hypothetical protein